MKKPIAIPKVGETSIQKAAPAPSKGGKQRSSRNAIRHGIFSEVVVLPGEAGDQYQSLLNDLQDSLKPEGGLEELLVEKLASLTWRHRRLLVAEGAEIRQGHVFLEWDKKNEERKNATNTVDLISAHLRHEGLIRNIHLAEVLKYCVDLLRDLKNEIDASKGLDRNHDIAVLQTIYGSEKLATETLVHRYVMWADAADASQEERQQRKYATPEQCKKEILDEIEKEIGRLREYGKQHASIESERAKLEVLRRSVPEAGKLDRLLRYETSLERAFDRTLSQLERIQQLRRGHPVVPRIDVNLSP